MLTTRPLFAPPSPSLSPRDTGEAPAVPRVGWLGTFNQPLAETAAWAGTLAAVASDGRDRLRLRLVFGDGWDEDESATLGGLLQALAAAGVSVPVQLEVVAYGSGLWALAAPDDWAPLLAHDTLVLHADGRSQQPSNQTSVSSVSLTSGRPSEEWLAPTGHWLSPSSPEAFRREAAACRDAEQERARARSTLPAQRAVLGALSAAMAASPLGNLEAALAAHARAGEPGARHERQQPLVVVFPQLRRWAWALTGNDVLDAVAARLLCVTSAALPPAGDRDEPRWLLAAESRAQLLLVRLCAEHTVVDPRRPFGTTAKRPARLEAMRLTTSPLLRPRREQGVLLLEMVVPVEHAPEQGALQALATMVAETPSPRALSMLLRDGPGSAPWVASRVFAVAQGVLPGLPIPDPGLAAKAEQLCRRDALRPMEVFLTAYDPARDGPFADYRDRVLRPPVVWPPEEASSATRGLGSLWPELEDTLFADPETPLLLSAALGQRARRHLCDAFAGDHRGTKPLEMHLVLAAQQGRLLQLAADVGGTLLDAGRAPALPARLDRGARRESLPFYLDLWLSRWCVGQETLWLWVTDPLLTPTTTACVAELQSGSPHSVVRRARAIADAALDIMARAVLLGSYAGRYVRFVIVMPFFFGGLDPTRSTQARAALLDDLAATPLPTSEPVSHTEWRLGAAFTFDKDPQAPSLLLSVAARRPSHKGPMTLRTGS